MKDWLAAHRPFRSYYVLAAEVGDALSVAAQYLALKDGFEIKIIDTDLYDALDEARPGYLHWAHHYIIAGHTGFAVVHGGKVVATAWLQRGPHSGGAGASYYPLAENAYWLHADWTHPEFRGQGLQKVLIARRVAAVYDENPSAVVECNIEPGNSVSIRQYQKLGFGITGKLVRLVVTSEKGWSWKII